MRIDKVEPTVLFEGAGDDLRQVVNVTLEGDTGVPDAEIVFRFPGRSDCRSRLGDLELTGEAYRVKVPDVREPARVEVALEADGTALDRREVDWRPRKHWRVHLVPISHHDLGYTDTIENVLAQYCGMYEDALRFCRETDDWPYEAKFRYTAEGSWSLRHFVEQASPETVKELAKRVAEGRIEIPALVGNVISAMYGHEEQIRLLYPSFRLKRLLGGEIRTGGITDVPGLSWGLPTVLAGTGVKYFFAGLPTYFRWGRNDIHEFWDADRILREHGPPDAFYWQGPNGGKVLVYYQVAYGCWHVDVSRGIYGPRTCEDVLQQLPGMLDKIDTRGNPFSVARYGGYGGADNLPPTLAASEVARDWNARWAFPKLIVSTNTMFFEELERQCESLRTFSGELPHTDYSVGALCAADVTALNRATHDRLPAAERFAAIASFENKDAAQSNVIERAYMDMMLFDEHTWGYKTPVGHVQDLAWHEKSAYAYRAAAAADTVLANALQRIAGGVDRRENVPHVIVFNALAFERSDIVRLEEFSIAEPFEIVDVETGEKVPYQVETLDDPSAPMRHAPERFAMGRFNPEMGRELIFEARNVPSLGYKTYKLVPAEPAPVFESSFKCGEHTIENRFYKVTLDPNTGVVAGIFDKSCSRELIDPAAAHGANQVVVRKVASGELACQARATVGRGRAGPVCRSLVVSTEVFGCPRVTQEIVLYENIKRIDFNSRVLKDFRPALEVYFAFPFNVDRPSFVFEGSNSVIRPFRDQFPGSNTNYYTVQHWADVSDGETGIAFAPLDAHVLEFGGLWPCYVSQAHHGVTPAGFGKDFVAPSEVKKGHLYSFVLNSNFRTNFRTAQQGEAVFRYSIATHAGDWKAGGARDFGWSRANPLRAVLVEGGVKGSRPACASFCRVKGTNVVLTALKRAEDGDGFVARLIETEGRHAEVTVALPLLDITGACLTNPVEEDTEAITVRGHSVTVGVAPFGITTIRLRVQEDRASPRSFCVTPR